MSLTAKPALNHLQLTHNTQHHSARQSLWSVLSATDTPYNPNQPIIATGHQPALWHPGILAKYLATQALAKHHNAQTFNIIVDQDTAPALNFKYPTQQDQTLSLNQAKLAPQYIGAPATTLPPADTNTLIQNIQKIQANIENPNLLNPLKAAVQIAPKSKNLPTQIAHILNHLIKPYDASLPFILATDLLTLPASKTFIAQLLADAPNAIRHYNTAVNKYNTAQIPPLLVSQELVQLPLWAIKNKARTKVYADITTQNHILVDDHFNPIDSTYTLAPQALTLTAITRLQLTDLFIHGTGGYIYDQITTHWLTSWLKQTPAPYSLITADLYLTFTCPTATSQNLITAINQHHHLKHNITQTLPDAHPDTQHKKSLLSQMQQTQHKPDHKTDRKTQRKTIFKKIHTLKDKLHQDHPHLLTASQNTINQTQSALQNTQIANLRDFPFILHPKQSIISLIDQIDQQLNN